MDKDNGKKILIIVVLLVLAGGILAWQFKLFGGNSSTDAPVVDIEDYTVEQEQIVDDDPTDTTIVMPRPDKPR